MAVAATLDRVQRLGCAELYVSKRVMRRGQVEHYLTVLAQLEESVVYSQHGSFDAFAL
jgi:hypothetical protein